MEAVCKLRSKFNDALNDAVAKAEQYILTINSCNAYEDFTKTGTVSNRGKSAFWHKIDDLIHHFDMNKVNFC